MIFSTFNTEKIISHISDIHSGYNLYSLEEKLVSFVDRKIIEGVYYDGNSSHIWRTLLFQNLQQKFPRKYKKPNFFFVS